MTDTVREAAPTIEQLVDDRDHADVGAVDSERGTKPRPTPPRADAPDDIPRWLLVVAFTTAAAVLAFGFAGLVLAINGWYRPALAFPLGAVGVVGLVWLVRALFRGPPTISTRAHVIAAVGLAAIAAITVWNGAHASQHVLINRDAGSYTTEGRWIARSGGLDVRSRVGPFAAEPSLSYGSSAVYDTANGTLQPQFAHMLPALLAEAQSAGGDGAMLHLAPLLGGIALLAFFVLAWRLLRNPWFAIGALLAFAFAMPQVSFSRDNYSEIPCEVLLFTAIWLMTNRRVLPPWPLALAAGLFLGATEATRIDGIAFLVGVPVVLGAAWWIADRAGTDRGRVVRSGIALILGLVPGLLLGVVDLTRHSGGYFDSLSNQFFSVVGAIIGSSLVTALTIMALQVLHRRTVRVRMQRVAWGAAAAVAVVGVGVWLLRPLLQTVHATGLPAVNQLQHVERIAIDGTRRYSEYSLSWMAWYLGPITIGAAIAGAALLARAFLLGRQRHAIAAVCVLVPGTVVYLWNPSAVPDHIWVDRRMLTGAIPLLVLLAFGLCAAVVARVHRSRTGGSRLLRVGAFAVAAVAVAYPIYAVAPVAAMTEQRPFLKTVKDACDILGPKAAVVMLDSNTSHLYLPDRAPPALRAWCGADVAIMRGPPDAAALGRLATQWEASGRKLFVVADAANAIQNVLPGVPTTLTRMSHNTKMLEPTLTRRPSRYQPQRFWMVLASVPPSR